MRVCVFYFNQGREISIDSLGEFDICYREIGRLNTWHITEANVSKEEGEVALYGSLNS
jgi:hypothetical protein